MPRVTGYLVKMPFKEGAEVKKGDLLFEIDPRPYKAQLDQAEGQVNLNEASLKLAQATYERDLAICDDPRRRQLSSSSTRTRPRWTRPWPRVKAAAGSRRGLQAQPRIHQGHRRPSTARSAATT